MSNVTDITREEFLQLWTEGYPVAVIASDHSPAGALWSSAAAPHWGYRDAEDALATRAHQIGALQTPRFIRRVPGSKRPTLDEVAGFIFRREPFRSATMRGAFARVGNLGQLGDLPPQERVKLGAAAREFGTFLYIVWSYDTPIAWAWPNHGRSGETPAAAYMPPVRYSLTTNGHQSLVATALGVRFNQFDTYSAHEPGTTQGPRGGGYTPYGPRRGGDW